MSERSPRRAPIEPLSPQAWQRVESAIFARLDDGVALSMPSRHASQRARATRRSLCYHWPISVALAVSASAVASVVHRSRSAASVAPASSQGLSVARAERASLVVPLPSSEPMPSVAPATSPVPVLRAPVSVRASTAAALDPSYVARSLSNDAPRLKSAGTRRPAPRSDRETRVGCAAGLQPEDAARALTLYLALANGQDAEAANALYAAARLELDRGDPESGILLLGEYSERFPDGENIVDVEALRAQFRALAAD
jgi:hypothetical protein